MKVKLIRVTDGLYRSPNGSAGMGGITVARRDAWRGKTKYWVVKWVDILSTRHEREFQTLQAARDWLSQEQ